MDLNNLAIELFCQFDPEQKGYITQDELLSNKKDSPFSDVQILSIFSLLDKEKKGIITLTDFTDAFLDVSDGNRTDYDDYSNLASQNEYDDENENLYGRIGENDEVYDNDSDGSDGGELYDDDIFHHMNDFDKVENGRTFIKRDSKRYSSVDSIINEKLLVRTSSTKESLNKKENNYVDEYWWDHGKRINSLVESFNLKTLKRQDSLPSLIDSSKRVKHKNRKKWRSCDHGIDKCFIASNNIAFNIESEKNKKLPTSRCIDSDTVSLRQHVFEEERRTYENNTKNSEMNKRVSKELDEIFGSASTISLERSNSCTCLSSNRYSSDGKLYNQALTSSSNGYFSSSSVNVCQDGLRHKRKPSSLLLKSHSSQELCKRRYSRDSFYNSETSDDNDNSCENVPKSRDTSYGRRCSVEEWQIYLRRIGGVSLFAG